MKEQQLKLNAEKSELKKHHDKIIDVRYQRI